MSHCPSFNLNWLRRRCFTCPMFLSRRSSKSPAVAHSPWHASSKAFAVSTACDGLDRVSLGVHAGRETEASLIVRQLARHRVLTAMHGHSECHFGKWTLALVDGSKAELLFSTGSWQFQQATALTNMSREEHHMCVQWQSLRPVNRGHTRDETCPAKMQAEQRF
jgi:hypothetical protein